MSNYISYFFYNTGQLFALLAVGLIWLGFTAIGAAFGPKERLAETDHLVGWALACFLFTLSGVFLKLPFTTIATILALGAFAALFTAWYRHGNILPEGTGQTLILGLPLLVLVSGMHGSQWDEFGTWLMIPRYMLETNTFPSTENSYANAYATAYPYNWHYITFLASHLLGGLLESSGPLFNILLLFGFGLLIRRLLFIGAGRSPGDGHVNWSLTALCILAVTLLNPTFAQKIVLTSYAETSSAVVLGTASVIAWFLLEALEGQNFSRAKMLALNLGLLLALLINLKQATLVLVILVILATLIIALRDPRIPLTHFVRLLPMIIAPAVVIYFTWRYYLTTELALSELSIQPFSKWPIGLIPQILAKMLLVLAKKGAYLALVVTLIIIGLRGFWRSETALDRFAALATLIVLGYNTFLLFAYVTTFGKSDALRAASYWRYNMHLGGVLVAFTAYGSALLWQKTLYRFFDIRRIVWLPVVLVLVAPFIFAHKLRFDRVPSIIHYRGVGASMKSLVHSDDSIFISDPRGSGESSTITRFELGDLAQIQGWVSAFSPDKLKPLLAAINTPKTTAVLVYSTFDGYEAALGLTLQTGRSHLLRRGGSGWHIVRSWIHQKK